MKKLRLLLVFCVMSIGYATWAQEVYTSSTSSPTACNGSAFLSNAGAYNNITWSDINANLIQSGGDSIANLCTGQYVVTFRDDSAGPSYSVTFEITYDSMPCNNFVGYAWANANTDSINCNGAAAAYASGGTAPFTYSWSNGTSGNSIDGICEGTYTVTITDANGCVSSTSITIIDSSGLTPCYVNAYLSASSTIDSSCTGTITAVAYGGLYPYTYVWSNGATGSTISNLCAGTYFVTITDANGCSNVFSGSVLDSATTTNPCNLAVQLYSSLTSGMGMCDGTISTSVSNGIAPYSFSWSNGATTNNIWGLCSGTYTVTLTDGNGCTAVGSTYVADSSSSTCAGFYVSGNSYSQTDSIHCNGAVFATAHNGSAPYSYTWSTGDTANTIYNVCAGTYFVTVTDANGCVASDSIIVSDSTVAHEPCANFSLYSYSYGQTDPNICNGGAVVYTIGGVAPYTYSWSNGVTEPYINDVCAGTYSVTVTDANGCVDGTLVFVIDSTFTHSLHAIAYTFDVTDPVNCNGQVDVVVSGGQAPYTFLHTSGATTADATGLCPDFYSVLVTDATGATTSVDYLIVDSSNVIKNEPYGDSVSIGTIFSDVLNGCGIDLEDVIDAHIVYTQSTSTDSITVWWNVYTATDTLELVVTHFIGNLPNGVCNVVLYLFCPNKNEASFLKVIDQIYVDKKLLGTKKTHPTVEVFAYPNPFSDEVTIRLNASSSFDLHLFDLSGRQLLTKQVIDQSVYTLKELSHLSSGSYIVRISTETATTSIQIKK